MNQQLAAPTESVPPPQADLLTADQVVDALLKFPKLRQLTTMCVLPAVRVGDEWRFDRSELEAWIRRHV